MHMQGSIIGNFLDLSNRSIFDLSCKSGYNNLSMQFCVFRFQIEYRRILKWQ